MHTTEDLARAFYAPGRIGQSYRFPGGWLSPAALASRLVVLVVLPALGLGWVLLYSLTGATSFKLTLQFGTAVDVGPIAVPPAVLIPILAMLAIGVFWFVPMALFFAFNAAIPANRYETKGRFFWNFVAAMAPCFGIHLAFLALSFWLMTSQATFFWGMRTVEDGIFTIAILISLGVQLASMFVTSKNYFARGLAGSVAALLVMASALGGLLYALLS